MLHEHLALLLAEGRRELILVCALLVGVPDLGLLAGLLEKVVAGHFLASQSHAEGGPDLAERNSLHLHGGLGYVVALEMSELDRVQLATACEDHHSFQLLNIGFLQALVMEEIYTRTTNKSASEIFTAAVSLTYKQTLQPFMPVVCLEVLALENQDRLHVRVDVLGCLESVRGLEVGDSQLEHVEDVAVENAPNHQIIRSLLLMAPNCEQTAVVLHGLVLNQTGVFHRDEVVGVADEHLDSLTALH